MTTAEQAEVAYQKKLATLPDYQLTLEELRQRIIYRDMYQWEKAGQIKPGYEAQHKRQRYLLALQDVWINRYAFATVINPILTKEDIRKAEIEGLNFWAAMCDQSIFPWVGGVVNQGIKVLREAGIKKADFWIRLLTIMQLKRIGYPVPLPVITTETPSVIVTEPEVSPVIPSLPEPSTEYGLPVVPPSEPAYEYGIPIPPWTPYTGPGGIR